MIDAGGETALRHAVEALLNERRQLLVRFCQLAGASPDEVPALLEAFCQILIDYTSLWQFEVHVALLSQQRTNAKLVQCLEREQVHILRADEAALAFNDHYDESKERFDPRELDRRLSLLGEQLATRFDAEDRILAAL